MPGGDGTGPLGLGPRTGRARGYCAGYPLAGSTGPGPGWGYWPQAGEKELLKRRAELLRERLRRVEARLGSSPEDD